MLASACGCSGHLWESASTGRIPSTTWSQRVPAACRRSYPATAPDEMRAFCLLAWILPLAGAAPAFAQEDEPEVPPPPAGEPDAEVPSFASAPAPSPPTKLPIPPGVDYPPVQALRGESTIYLDYTYEISNDLSTFYWVKGHAAGHRVALGGNLHLGGLQLNAELPVQLTQLFIDSLGNQAPTAADREKSSYSLADVIAGAATSGELPTPPSQYSAGWACASACRHTP